MSVTPSLFGHAGNKAQQHLKKEEEIGQLKVLNLVKINVVYLLGFVHRNHLGLAYTLWRCRSTMGLTDEKDSRGYFVRYLLRRSPTMKQVKTARTFLPDGTWGLKRKSFPKRIHGKN